MPKEKIIKALTITALVAIYVFTVGDWRANGQLDNLNPFIASLTHANVAHLAVNGWALWALWRKPMWLILPAYVIGTIGIAADGNAVGISAMLFALMGLQWHLYDCKRNRWIVTAMMAASLLIPHLSFVAHAIPFFSAMLINRVWSLIKRFRNDTGRGQI